jgi:hypothetical protein
MFPQSHSLSEGEPEKGYLGREGQKGLLREEGRPERVTLKYKGPSSPCTTMFYLRYISIFQLK